jgi:hypothetical protein
MVGGAMTVGGARRLLKKQLHGGNLAEEAAKAARNILDFYRKAESFLAEFEEQLDDVDYPDGTNAANIMEKEPDSLKAFSLTLLSYLDKIKPARQYLNLISEGLKLVGIGKNKKLHGGDMYEDASKFLTTVADFADWVYRQRFNIRDTLSGDVFGDVGKKIVEALKPFWGEASGSGKCLCDKKRGGKKKSVKYQSVLERLADEHRGGFLQFPNVFQPQPQMSIENMPAMIDESRSPGQGLRPRPGVSGRVESNQNDVIAECSARLGISVGDLKQMMDKKVGGMRMKKPLESYSDRPVGGRSCGGKKARAPSARGEIVKKVMREKGLSLPQASKYVKEHGLY